MRRDSRVSLRIFAVLSSLLLFGAGCGFVDFGGTGQPNVTEAGQVGGGLEFKPPSSRLSIRTEVRDYISGNPRIAELFFGLHGDTTSTLYAGGGATFHF